MKLRMAIIALVLVLLPVGVALAQAPGTIYEILVADGNFKNLVSAIDKANVSEVKNPPGPFTMFAPNDEAFAKLPPGTLDRIMGDDSILKNVFFTTLFPVCIWLQTFPVSKNVRLCSHRSGPNAEINQGG